nr:immunoglobulin light chain junction region [Macaca mulatta]
DYYYAAWDDSLSGQVF